MAGFEVSTEVIPLFDGAAALHSVGGQLARPFDESWPLPPAGRLRDVRRIGKEELIAIEIIDN